MMPIHELLSRIRRDEAFGQAEFEIGYYDRLLGLSENSNRREGKTG